MSLLVAFLLLWGEASPGLGPLGQDGGKGQEWGPHSHISTGLSLRPAPEAAVGESGRAWDGGHMGDLGWCAHTGGSPVLVPRSNSCPHAAIDIRPNLWAESESLLEPWANVTLTCQAILETLDFQLFKNGVCQEHVHLDLVTTEHRFLLGAVTGDTRGLYRCRSGKDEGWTGLSNLLEMSGEGEKGLLWASLLPPHPPVLFPHPPSLPRGDLGHVT